MLKSMFETARILKEFFQMVEPLPLFGPLEVIMFLHGKSKEFEASLGTFAETTGG